MNDFTELYKKAEKCRKKKHCDCNEMVCAKKLIQQYIDNDHNKLLKLKAEIEIADDKSSEINNLMLVLSVSSICVTVISGNDIGSRFYGLFVLMIVGCLIIKRILLCF